MKTKENKNDFYKDFFNIFFNSFKNNFIENFEFEIMKKTKLNDLALERLETEKQITSCINNESSAILYLQNNYNFYIENISQFEYLYKRLINNESKKKMLEILCYKILGFTKIKLSKKELYDNKKEMQLINQYSHENDILILDNFRFDLKKFSFLFNNNRITMYFLAGGIYIDFIMEQYNYNNIVCIEEEDIVIDGGACWGDTALYFASSNAKKVYSFEFIQSNCNVFEKNISLNPDLANKIELIKHPLWDESNINLSYSDNGPSSNIGNQEQYYNKITSISLDDFAKEKNIEKIDFIKMDIEGAELNALKGAKNVIKSFKPKLAISIYHKNRDMIDIPKYIQTLNPDYEFYFDYYTTYGYEIMLYAKNKEK